MYQMFITLLFYYINITNFLVDISKSFSSSSSFSNKPIFTKKLDSAYF